MSHPPLATNYNEENYKRFSKICGQIASFVGFVVVLGWILDIPQLKSISPNFASMKLNSAICFILLGLTLQIYARNKQKFSHLGMAQILSIITTLISGLTLLEYISGIDFGIDQLFFVDTSQKIYAGRMSPATGISFFILSSVLALKGFTKPIFRSIQQVSVSVSVSVVLLICLISFLGYLYNVKELYQISAFTSIAIHTVLTLMIVSLGVLSLTPSKSIILFVSSKHIGNILMRRTLPAVLMSLLLLGWGSYKGMQFGLYPHPFDSIFTIILDLLVFSILIGMSAKLINASGENYLVLFEKEKLARQEVESYFNLPNLLFGTASSDGYFKKVNGEWEKLLGYPVDEILAHPWLYFVHPEDQGKTIAEASKLSEGSNVADFQNRYRCKNGNYIWLDWSVIPKDDQFYCVGRDITRLKEAELITKSIKVKLESVIEHTPIILWAADLNGILTLSEGQALSVLGLKPGQINGMSLFELYKEKPELSAYARRALSGESFSVEVQIGEAYFNVHYTPVKNDEYKIIGIAGVSIEITEKKLAELESRASEEKFRATFNQAAVGIAHVGLDGQWLKVNQKICDIVGYTEKELLSKTFQDITHPEDLNSDLANVEKVLNDEITTYSMEKRYFKKSGEIIWINLTVSLVRDETGNPKYFISVVEDISEKRATREALKVLNEQLDYRVRERTRELVLSNNELEQFAYVASHDLREPLRMVSSYVELLEKRMNPTLEDDSIRKYMKYIQEGALRMQALISDLLAYSRSGRNDLEKKSEDLNILVKNVLFNLKEQIEETHAEIEIDQLPIALINQIQLGQVFQNLIGNAIKFHGEGIPKIKIFSVRKHSEWIISVKDNGIGIEKQYFDRIFVLFQRLHTRTEYQGTGIGLSVCKKIVERHGGKIWVESNPGNGTIFNFSIPDKFQTELTQTKFLPYVQQNREIRQ